MWRSFLAFLVLLFVIAATAQQPPPDSSPGGTEPGRRERRGRFQGVGGTITALNGTSMTLKTFDGGTATVTLSDKTRYLRDGQEAKLSDFKVGEPVVVRAEPAGGNTWTALGVMTRSDAGNRMREGLGKRFIAGEIKSIAGTKLTILRIDGETQTIEVDENTSFRKQGESVTLADLKPGDHVFGRGEIKEGGVFHPQILNVGDYTRMRNGPPRREGEAPR